MKIKHLLLLLLSLLHAPVVEASVVTMRWSYDFSNGTLCSTQVTGNCLDHFEVGMVVGTAFQTLASIPIPPSPAGKVTGITSPDININTVFGVQQLAVVMVAKDAAGNRFTSSMLATGAAITITISPSAPTDAIGNTK